MENNNNIDTLHSDFPKKGHRRGQRIKKPDHFDNNPTNPVYSKPWIPNHPEYSLNGKTEPQSTATTKHLFTIHLGAWAKFIRDVVATILMIKLMSSL